MRFILLLVHGNLQVALHRDQAPPLDHPLGGIEIVMTPMNEGHLRNPDVARWTPGVRRGLEAMGDKSPEPAIRLVLFLASGKADALSGRFFDAEADDMEELVQQADAIEREDRRVLRLRP